MKSKRQRSKTLPKMTTPTTSMSMKPLKKPSKIKMTLILSTPIHSVIGEKMIMSKVIKIRTKMVFKTKVNSKIERENCSTILDLNKIPKYKRRKVNQILN
jgi:hypothetical protein